MSNREPNPSETLAGAQASCGPVHQMVEGRDVPITKTSLVNRTLPHRDRRMIGAWCFADVYGPEAVINMPGMRVPPHPHIGLQTVSWLLDGAIEHRDSLGSVQLIRPGELNLMTAGRGISHSEQSPRERPPQLHGAQLWIALPEGARRVEPRFEHVADLPRVTFDGIRATVLVGSLGDATQIATSSAQVHTPLVGADLEVTGAGVVPLEPSFEHGVVVTSGEAEVDGESLTPGRLLFLGCGRSDLAVSSSGARALLLGGEPFDEQVVMWWNFVARTHDEIDQARSQWMAGLGGGSVFGQVHGFDGAPLPAPALPTARLRPRGRA